MSEFYREKTCSCNSSYINHMYEKNPTAYYGSDNHPRNIDVARTKVSTCTPGVMSGLYRADGPLNICPASCVNSILTNVITTSKMYLDLKFKYTNSLMDKIVRLEQGKIYTIDYIENGDIKRCSGMVTDIYKIYKIDNNDNLYKIKIDCSTNYSNSVVIIKNDQIRDCKIYIPYSEEDTTILNSSHKYATTVGDIKEAIITNASVDKNGNILEGTIVDGIVYGHTVDGLANGQNQSHHEIYVKNGNTIGGRIINGLILNGIVRSGDIDGKLDETTLITEKATVKGIIANVVIVNSTVEGGKTSNGTIINPIIENSTVSDAQITGDDLITTGGVTIGNITTGGTTIGGTATGGTATGNIDNERFTIEDGITTPIDSDHQLVTTGGTVVGGTIIGGTQIGNAIINATIKGGVVTGGVTTGGTTSGGTLIPTNTANVSIAKPIGYNPDYDKVNADNRPTYEINQEKNLNNKDFIIWTDGEGMYTNAGKWQPEEIQNIK